MNDKELDGLIHIHECMREWDMKAKHMRNYDDKYRVVLKFNDKESATDFIKAWNEVHKWHTQK